MTREWPAEHATYHATSRAWLLTLLSIVIIVELAALAAILLLTALSAIALVDGDDDFLRCALDHDAGNRVRSSSLTPDGPRSSLGGCGDATERNQYR